MEKEKTNKFETKNNSETEVEKERELPQSNRIVVFGLRENINSVDKIINNDNDISENVELFGIRMSDNIEDGFYGRSEKSSSIEKEPKRLSTIDRLKKFVLRSQIESPSITESEKVDYGSLPKGVIIFPEMRQYDVRLDAGMNIDTPFEKIEKLCLENNVNFKKIESSENNIPETEIKKMIKSFSE